MPKRGTTCPWSHSYWQRQDLNSVLSDSIVLVPETYVCGEGKLRDSMCQLWRDSVAEDSRHDLGYQKRN